MIEKAECIVVANGLFPSEQRVLDMLEQAAFVVACDGAVVTLESYRRPDAIVGDLDSLPVSLRQKYCGLIRRVGEQETNDLTKAMKFVREAGFRDVVILGATGLREDHTLGNISLLGQYVRMFNRVEMVSDFGVFTPIFRTTRFKSKPGQPVSLFALHPSTVVSVTGLRYPVERRRFQYWWEATLNVAVGTTFEVIIEEEEGGVVLVYRAFLGSGPESGKVGKTESRYKF